MLTSLASSSSISFISERLMMSTWHVCFISLSVTDGRKTKRVRNAAVVRDKVHRLWKVIYLVRNY